MKGMVRIYAISLTLIAASAGAGFGLSALHGMNLDDQPQIINTASLAPTDSGFLIPEFVPVQPTAPALAPLTPSLTPSATAPAAVLDAALWIDPGVSRRPAPRGAEALSAWQDAQPRAVIPNAATPRGVTPSTSTQAIAVRMAPARVVAPAREPDYLVGVYR